MAERIRRARGLLTVAAVVIGLATFTGMGVQGWATGQEAPCQDDDYEQDDGACWTTHLVPAGTVETHRLCDRDWIELDMLEGATYVVETRNLVGGADTILQLWFMNWTGSCGVHGPPDLSDDDGGSGGGSRLEWVAPYTTWRRPNAVRSQAVVKGKGYGEGMGYELSVECVADCPPEGEILVVPWVERGVGPSGGLLRTELRLLNPSPVEVPAELQLRTGDESRRAHLAIAGRDQLRVDDVVADLFGMDAASGLLQVRTADEPLVGLAWTFEERPGGGGRVGHVMPARRLEEVPIRVWWHGRAAQATFEVGGLEESVAVDTRVSLGEVMGLPTSLELSLRASDGTELGWRWLIIEPHGILTLDDVCAFFGVPSQGGASLEVAGQGMGRVLGQVLLRDCASQDSIAVQQWSRSGTRLVPAVASAQGAFGSSWTTDLVMSAIPVWGPTEVWLTFLPRDGWNVDLKPVILTLEPGETRVIEDVVGWLGETGAGALLVGSHELAVWSRVESLTGGTVVAQHVPAMGPESMVGLGGGTLVALGVERSPEVRTNVGWVNATSNTGTVAVRLVAGDGTLLGSRSYPLRPLSPSQLNDVFLHFGVPSQGDCRVELEVVEGEAWILAYASRVDNRSGDAVFVPAAHVPRLDNEPVVLSNRDNCVLVDRLPGAVGVDLLPPGEFAATLSGGARVGPGSYDRLEVVCLYHDLDGDLGAAKVPRYSSLDGIAGDAPLWCFAPDRVTRDDNSGTATLVVSSGVNQLTFNIDAATDAVLVDQLAEAVVVEHPHRSYHLLARGDLGRPGLEPHLVLVYWREWPESNGLTLATHGDWPDNLSPGAPLAAVVLDWINADDNTGESRLVPSEHP